MAAETIHQPRDRLTGQPQERQHSAAAGGTRDRLERRARCHGAKSADLADAPDKISSGFGNATVSQVVANDSPFKSLTHSIHIDATKFD
jgi:hypothetical protein